MLILILLLISLFQKAVLNFPSYMQKFLQNESNSITAIAKVTERNTSEVAVSEIQTSFGDQPNEILSSTNSSENPETAETPIIKVYSNTYFLIHCFLSN